MEVCARILDAGIFLQNTLGTSLLRSNEFLVFKMLCQVYNPDFSRAEKGVAKGQSFSPCTRKHAPSGAKAQVLCRPGCGTAESRALIQNDLGHSSGNS